MRGRVLHEAQRDGSDAYEYNTGHGSDAYLDSGTSGVDRIAVDALVLEMSSFGHHDERLHPGLTNKHVACATLPWQGRGDAVAKRRRFYVAPSTRRRPSISRG
jgi:hypothetical protein